MVLDFAYYIYYRYKNDDNDIYSFLDKHHYVFVLGFDVNGKLFVNEIPYMFYNYKDGMVKIFEGKCVEIKVVDRDEVMNSLGFEYDVADRELIEISNVGRYRVQGEIVLNVVRELSNVEEFYRNLVNRSGIATYVENYIMNYVAMALMDLGFGIDITNSIVLRNILHSNIVKNPDRIMKILKVLGFNIIEQLRKYMEIYAVNYGEGKDVYTDNYVVYFTIVSNITMFDLRILFNYFRPRPFQEPYSDIVITVAVNYDSCRLCREIEDEFIETLRSTPRQSVKMLLGNHLIELKNVYSSSIAFRPSRRLEIELIRLPTITNDLNAYFVDTESEITISHREHGVTKIWFSKPFLINFNTTTVMRNYHEKLNRVVLENIVNGNNHNKKMIDYVDM
jgi:hypothetical protein